MVSQQSAARKAKHTTRILKWRLESLNRKTKQSNFFSALNHAINDVEQKQRTLASQSVSAGRALIQALCDATNETSPAPNGVKGRWHPSSFLGIPTSAGSPIRRELRHTLADVELLSVNDPRYLTDALLKAEWYFDRGDNIHARQYYQEAMTNAKTASMKSYLKTQLKICNRVLLAPEFTRVEQQASSIKAQYSEYFQLLRYKVSLTTEKFDDCFTKPYDWLKQMVAHCVTEDEQAQIDYDHHRSEMSKETRKRESEDIGLSLIERKTEHSKRLVGRSHKPPLADVTRLPRIKTKLENLLFNDDEGESDSSDSDVYYDRAITLKARLLADIVLEECSRNDHGKAIYLTKVIYYYLLKTEEEQCADLFLAFAWLDNKRENHDDYRPFFDWVAKQDSTFTNALVAQKISLAYLGYLNENHLAHIYRQLNVDSTVPSPPSYEMSLLQRIIRFILRIFRLGSSKKAEDLLPHETYLREEMINQFSNACEDNSIKVDLTTYANMCGLSEQSTQLEQTVVADDVDKVGYNPS